MCNAGNGGFPSCKLLHGSQPTSGTPSGSVAEVTHPDPSIAELNFRNSSSSPPTNHTHCVPSNVHAFDYLLKPVPKNASAKR